MDLDRLTSLACRAFFALGFALLALYGAERLAFAFGYTILRGAFAGQRILALAGVSLTLVVALLLRQIREELRAGAPGRK